MAHKNPLTQAEQDWTLKAIQAGLPASRIEIVLVLARLFENTHGPEQIQNMFMDAHIGRNQLQADFNDLMTAKAQEMDAKEKGS